MASDWRKSTVIYQIYPRSFQDTNHDGVGDLSGIIQRLDYLKELGVETLWISPFFVSPQADFGYDIADYYNIDPLFGSMEDCERLIEETHRLAMKIVLDLVMNHTSDQHPWFQESRSSKDSAKRDWYIWRPGNGGERPPNNWRSVTGGQGWNWDAQTGEWYYASFLPFQPDLNYRNPDVQNEMLNMARFWLEKGVDGFRLDIFNCLFKDEQFRDNPISFRPLPTEDNPDGFFQQFKYNLNQPESMDFARRLRSVLEEFEPKRLLLGEVFGALPVIRGFCGEKENNGLNLVFAFQTLTLPFRAAAFRKMAIEMEAHFPPPFQPVYVFSNHDRARSLFRYGNDLRKAKTLALFQLTVRGVATIYMGEELGVTQNVLPLSEGKDPLAKKFRWLPNALHHLIRKRGVSLNRDECRSPMQWSAAPNADFCSPNVAPWTPFNPDYRENNWETQRENSESLYFIYKTLLALRKEKIVLREGKMEILAESGSLLGYRRELPNEKTIIVWLNFSEKSQLFVPPTNARLLFSIAKWENNGTLSPFQGCVFEE